MWDNMKIGFLFFLTSYFVYYAFRLLSKDNKTRENYYLLGFSVLIFISSYMITVLDYKIIGSSIGVEKTVQEIRASKDEIKKLANTVIKISHIVADGSGRIGGMPEEHLAQIKKYQDSIGEYLDKDLEQEIQKTISDLNKKIEDHNNRK